MKILLFLISWTTIAASENMIARFGNGDQLNGTLAHIEEGSLVWRSDAFLGPQAIKLDQVVDVTLPALLALDPPNGDHLAIATLTNGDEVRGTLLKVNDKEVGLRTNFAGDLVFRRDMVEHLKIEDRPEIFYSGPNSIDEWSMSEEGDWTYEDGKLTTSNDTAISIDVGEHRRLRVAFDVEWRNAARFRVYTCADEGATGELSNGFELSCDGRHVSMTRHSSGRPGSRSVGNLRNIRQLRELEKVRFEILMDLASGQIRLLIGGQTVANWRDNRPDAESLGGFLHFQGKDQKFLSVSRIRVTGWNGASEAEMVDPMFNLLGANMEEEPTEEQEDDDRGITLKNGDKINGEATGIEDGKVSITSPVKDFELPVSRLRSFQLRTAEESLDPNIRWEPIIRAKDIRASFVEGGSITFELLEFGDEAIRGRSQTFGEAEFRLSAFSRLEFNLYRPELTSQ